MKKLGDFGEGDRPAGDADPVLVAWTLAAFDDCEPCAELRIEPMVAEAGRPGTGVVGHFSPASARRWRAALALALHDIGGPV